MVSMFEEKPILDYSPREERRKNRIRRLLPLIVALALFATLVIYIVVTTDYGGWP